MSKSEPAGNVNPSDKVKNAIKELRGFRKWGEMLLRGKGEDHAWAKRYPKESSKAEMAGKAKKVADLIRPEDLEELCGLCLEHDFPLSIHHVIDTLSLDGSLRMALLRDAIRERWSVRELQRKIREVNGPPSHTGRTRNQPKTARDVYDAISQFYAQWRQLDNSFRLPIADMQVGPSDYQSNIDPQLSEQLTKAERAMQRLLDVTELLKSRPADPPAPPRPKLKLPDFKPLPVKPNRSSKGG